VAATDDDGASAGILPAQLAEKSAGGRDKECPGRSATALHIWPISEGKSSRISLKEKGKGEYSPVLFGFNMRWSERKTVVRKGVEREEAMVAPERLSISWQ